MCLVCCLLSWRLLLLVTDDGESHDQKPNHTN